MTEKPNREVPEPSEISEAPRTGGPSGSGEDDNSTEKNGDDSHLHDDQKSKIR